MRTLILLAFQIEGPSAFESNLNDFLPAVATKCIFSDRSITGLLVYDSGHFSQVLEGGYNEVEALFSNIQQDKRHARVNRIISGQIKERFFKDWNMGFYHLEEMSDLDFFKLRKCMKSLHAITSVEEQTTLVKYALKLFVHLKENAVEVG